MGSNKNFSLVSGLNWNSERQSSMEEVLPGKYFGNWFINSGKL